jgi:hypothetical protein
MSSATALDNGFCVELTWIEFIQLRSEKPKSVEENCVYFTLSGNCYIPRIIFQESYFRPAFSLLVLQTPTLPPVFSSSAYLT